MKTYVYIVVATDDNEIIAVYDNKEVADKMKAPIENKMGCDVTVLKTRVNPDIKIIGL